MKAKERQTVEQVIRFVGIELDAINEARKEAQAQLDKINDKATRINTWLVELQGYVNDES